MSTDYEPLSDAKVNFWANCSGFYLPDNEAKAMAREPHDRRAADRERDAYSPRTETTPEGHVVEMHTSAGRDSTQYCPMCVYREQRIAKAREAMDRVCESDSFYKGNVKIGRRMRDAFDAALKGE